MDKASHYLGINIGGTHCSMTLGNGHGEILAREAWPTANAPSPETAIASMQQVARSLVREVHPKAAGVAIGGPLDTRSGYVLGPPNLPGWDDLPLKDLLEKALQVPVQVAHDAAACALAEARFGNWNVDTLVYLTCGTGFGAGIVQEGRIMASPNGLHPEIGRWQLMDKGPVAFGKAGSAEALCSAKGLARLANWHFPERWPTEPEPATISHLAEEGDPEAVFILDQQAAYTGRVCAMIAEFFCPDLIILGSLANHLGKAWTGRVQDHFHKEVLPRTRQKVRVEANALRDRLQDLSALVVAQECIA